jgi:dimeric dUTPase (all-alpha-NTP-PPase superfamily)
MSKIFKKMVELQHEFNKKVFKDYLKKNLNWNSAIIVESGELLDSLGYKWWKKQEPDMDNVKVEAIDLLHFGISDAIQLQYDCSGEIDLTLIARTFEDHFNNSNGYLDGLSLNKLVDELNYNRWNRFIVMKKIFEYLNMTNKDVYIAYIVKNCLNKFRQDNGYKDGSYIKDWKGKEDNAIAYEIAEKWGADEELFELLYRDLDTHYNLFVKNKKTILDDIDYLIASDATEI